MKQVTIMGMSCKHCVSAVQGALKDLGLTGVSVDLVGGIATFNETDRVTPEQLTEAISEAGYEAAAIQ